MLNTCVICLSDIEYPYSIYECGHIFCKSCIDLYNKPFCPTCRNISENILTFYPNKTNISLYIKNKVNNENIFLYKVTIILFMIMILFMYYLLELQNSIKEIEINRLKEKIEEETLEKTSFFEFMFKKII
jgi:hypothetical protein